MNLPNEIILQILRSLEKCDLKSARLVSSTWTALAAEFLFDQAYVSVHPKNLEVFNSIAQHPLLSQCIKTLIYDAVNFEEDCTKDDYFERLMGQTRRCFPTSSVPSFGAPTLDDEINTWVNLVTTDTQRRPNHHYRSVWLKCMDYGFIDYGYQKYQRCAALQRAGFGNGTFLESLVGGLQRLRNISCVIVADGWHFRREVRKDPKKLLLKRPRGSPLARDWNIFHTCPQEWKFPYDLETEPERSATDGALHYWAITGALLRSQRKIQTFEVGNGSSHGVPPYLFDRSQVGSLSFLGLDIVALSGLEDLRLTIAAYGDESAPASFPKMDGLRLLLGSLRRLRFLALNLPWHFVVEDEFKPKLYDFGQIFPQEGHWSQLTSLSLSGFTGSAADLLTLFPRAMPNLTILRLPMIDLASGTWEGVIEWMSQLMHLSNFHIVNAQLWHRGGTKFFGGKSSPDPSAIEEYVVNGGRHPCLGSDEPDSAAQKYLTYDLKCFCQALSSN